MFEKGFSKGYKNGFREGENYAKRKRDEDRLIRKKDITEALAGQGENLIPFMAYVIQCAKIQSEMLTVQSTAINAHASEQRAALESLARVQQTANALLAAQHASIHQRQSQDEEEQEEVSAESANEEEEEQEQEEASAEMQQSEDPPPAEEPQELTLQNLTLRHFKGVNATGKSKKVTKTAKLLFINVFKALQKSPFEISAKFPEIIRPGTEEIDVPHLDKTMGAFSRERLDAFVAECSKVWK